MGYPLEVAPSMQPLLADDAQRIGQRLSDLRDGLTRLADNLYGPTPRPIVAKDHPEPQSSLRRHIDQAHSLLTEIEAELTKIASRL